MRQILRLFLAAIAAIAVPAPSAFAQTCDSSPLVIMNVSVWTARGLEPQRDVVMRNGRVASVRPAGAGRSGIARTIDGSGHTLLPGLIDSHLHFSIPGGLPATAGPRTDGDSITTRQVLRSGVTSGRLHLASLDNAVALKKQSQDPCAAIPRLQVGGPGLSGAQLKDSGAFMGAASVEDAVAKVEKFAAAGVDWIAVHDAHQFPTAVREAIATTARAANVRLMAAGSNNDEIRGALRLAPDTLDYFDRTQAPGYAPGLLDQIRGYKGLILAPTPGVAFRLSAYLRQPERLEEASNFLGLTPDDRAFVLGNARKELDGSNRGFNASVAVTIAEKLRQLRSLGLPMVIASDAGSPMQFQANAIWWEMETWRIAGISHREVLTAATVNGALLLRQVDVGHLRPGARADFVLYRGNVEDGPFDVTRVISVGKGGVIFATP